MIGVNGVLFYYIVVVKIVGIINFRGFKFDLIKLGKFIKIKINYNIVYCFDKKNDNINIS